MSSFVGIDLGTTFSAIAVIDESGRPVILHNKDGKNVTASCVSEQDGVVEVGEFAQKVWGETPELAAARFKRFMGTSQTYSINGNSYTPTELSAFVLKKLVKDVEPQIGKIAEAVITIPANFSHEAREATMAAAKLAGLNVNFIVNEPTAAALYYAFKSGSELHGNYAVYDLGGGTFDVSIIHANGQSIEVLASNGVSKLGGDDFDAAIVLLVKNKFKEQHHLTISDTDFSKNDAEEIKKALSTREKSRVKIGSHQVDVLRAELEASISALVAQTEMLCESTLDEAKIKTSEINGVFLVGGSTRLPFVRQSVQKVFAQEPQSTINVDEVVALGAAVYAAYKGGKAKLTEVQHKKIENVKVVESTSKCFGTIAVVHDSEREQVKLNNSIIIKKGDKIPCSISKSFYTLTDGQNEVECCVTESTSPETDPRFVKVVWKGALKLPSGRPADQEIKVTFAYDENQIMKCSFLDVATGRETKVDLSMTAASTTNSNINKFLVD